MSELTAEERARAMDLFEMSLNCQVGKGCPLCIDAITEAIREAEERGRQQEQETVAQWMIQNSLATGHGDTTEDLLNEAKWQLIERGTTQERERCAEIARNADALTPPSGWTEAARESYYVGCDDATAALAEAIMKDD